MSARRTLRTFRASLSSWYRISCLMTLVSSRHAIRHSLPCDSHQELGIVRRQVVDIQALHHFLPDNRDRPDIALKDGAGPIGCPVQLKRMMMSVVLRDHPRAHPDVSTNVLRPRSQPNPIQGIGDAGRPKNSVWPAGKQFDREAIGLDFLLIYAPIFTDVGIYENPIGSKVPTRDVPHLVRQVKYHQRWIRVVLRKDDGETIADPHSKSGHLLSWQLVNVYDRNPMRPQVIQQRA